MKRTALTPKEPKRKRCKACSQFFIPPMNRPLAVACSPACGIALTRHAPEEIEKIDKQHAREWVKEKRKELVTTSDWLQLLQQVFNTYIRERDKDKPCISSGRPLIGKYDAGHYFSTGAFPNLRFEEDNCHGQSVHDNRDKHGNLAEYLPRLIERIGQERFDALVAKKNDRLSLSEDQIKEKIAYYKQRIKELKN